MVTEHDYFAGREKMRGYEASKEIIGDELADILAMVIQLAEHYDIDLIDAHIKAQD
jgi:NTP pyrophosphatase (non-canonical NTP hydrolase)